MFFVCFVFVLAGSTSQILCLLKNILKHCEQNKSNENKFEVYLAQMLL